MEKRDRPALKITLLIFSDRDHCQPEVGELDPILKTVQVPKSPSWQSSSVTEKISSDIVLSSLLLSSDEVAAITWFTILG